MEDLSNLKISQSLVQIKAITKHKDHLLQKDGVGIIVKNNRVLTNLHTVIGADDIQIKRVGDDRFIPAKIEFMGYDCDLATLSPLGKNFHKNKLEIPMTSSLISAGEKIEIVGFHNSQLQYYFGKIIDIRFESYGHSGIDFHKIIETDFKIHEGISGSPAFSGKKFAGIAFQSSSSKSRIIHRNVVIHFLRDIEDGVYNGFTEIGFQFQKNPSEELKKYFRIAKEISGVFVTLVIRTSGFENILQPKDFINAIDGILIDDSGNMGEKEEILDYFEKKNPGDLMKISFYRGGKKYEVNHKLNHISLFDFYRDRGIQTLSCQGINFRVIGKGSVDFSQEDFESSLAYHYFYLVQDDLGQFSNSVNFVLTRKFPSFRQDIRGIYVNQIVESVNSIFPQSKLEFESICRNSKEKFIQIKFRGKNLPFILKNSYYRNK